MNCQEALDLLYDYIDKEASKIDAHEVQRHLEDCRHCFEIFRMEESVQELINEKLSKPEPTPRLDSLKKNILNRLDEIDNDKPATGSTRPQFFRASRILAMAATLVLLIGAAFLVSDFYQHNTRYVPLERAHWNSIDHPERYEDKSSTSEALARLYDSYKYQLNDNISGFHLAGGRMESIMKANMAHFLYEKGKEAVSVFVADAGSFRIPDDLRGNAVVINGVTYYDHNCRGCRLVYHQIGNAVVITASTDRDIDLLSFRPEVGEI